MAYCKAAEEKKWLRWKENEEKTLRALGVDEDKIQRLHDYDWAQFNKERQYLQRWRDEPQPEIYAEVPETEHVFTVEALLDTVEDERLFWMLKTADPKTLEMLFLKTLGYSAREIAHKTGVSEDAVNNRISRIRKKLKKFL